MNFDQKAYVHPIVSIFIMQCIMNLVCDDMTHRICSTFVGRKYLVWERLRTLVRVLDRMLSATAQRHRSFGTIE